MYAVFPVVFFEALRHVLSVAVAFRVDNAFRSAPAPIPVAFLSCLGCALSPRRRFHFGSGLPYSSASLSWSGGSSVPDNIQEGLVVMLCPNGAVTHFFSVTVDALVVFQNQIYFCTLQSNSLTPSILDFPFSLRFRPSRKRF